MRTEQYYKNGNISSISYRNSDGDLHNENGPAVINFHPSKEKKSEEYYINGELHNDNGPAVLVYKNNMVIAKYYFKHGNIIDGELNELHYLQNHFNWVEKYYYLNNMDVIKRVWWNADNILPVKTEYMSKQEKIPESIFYWCIERNIIPTTDIKKIPKKFQVEFKLVHL